MFDRRTYFLDLRTLLTYLKDQSCELTTEVKISGKVAKGSLLLKDGVITRCLLVLHNGTQVSGEQALKQLETATQWHVELTQPDEKEKATLPRISSPSSFPGKSSGSMATPRLSSPLRQKRTLDPAYLENLPARERFIVRSVFSMINGRRRCEDIKAQLSFSAWDIEHAVNWLRALDVID